MRIKLKVGAVSYAIPKTLDFPSAVLFIFVSMKYD